MSATKRQRSPMKLCLESPKKHKLININVSTKQCGEIGGKQTDPLDDFEILFNDDADFSLTQIDAAEKKGTDCIPKLDLTNWTRCVVVSVEREKRSYDLVLEVHAEREKNKKNVDARSLAVATCHLQDAWSHTRVEVGDTLSIQSVWDVELQAYRVNKDQGFCVINPDTLISGTSVVGSLFCRRKAVLQDRFKGIDAGNKVMVIGCLVHELLQTVLANSIKDCKEINAVMKSLLESPEVAHTLYANLLAREEIAEEVQKYLPNILAFVQQYVEGKPPALPQDNVFQGTITEIQDIEENLWVPQFGLKGKIDVSVRVNRRRNPLKLESANNNTMPLELKTGRASFSLEHKGQLILYQMMLTAVGQETHSGLLLYLREGIMREIHGARNEQRDLVVLRNDLAYFLSHFPKPPPIGDLLTCGKGKFVQPLKLPEPISHHNACSSCPYATICCTFAKTDPELQLYEGHPLHKVMREVTSHLEEQDYDYFMRWCGLLSLEEQEARKSNYVRSLWTETPEARQRQGRAVIGLKCELVKSDEPTQFLHTFKFEKQTEDNELDLTLCGLSLGEYVIISSNKRIAIAAGRIFDLSKSTISISLERNLTKNYAGESFIVDKHESQSGNVFNFTNLGLLLDDSERATTLRGIVVHRQQPTYVKKLPKVLATEGVAVLKKLNVGQRAAVLKALTTDSFMLIKGLPGTGKTQTLVAIVQLLHVMGKSVLITSHTHSAVDNLFFRLKEYKLPMLRLGSAARANPQLKEFSEPEVIKDCKTEAELAAKYAAFSIIGVTCLGASHSIFLHRKFDYCIVDEATQVMQTTVLRPLLFCDRFILVGDPDQLPPLIRSREARLRGADESLFQRLDTQEATAVLTLQYRMNKSITKLANELTYGGELKCASSEVQLATLQLKLSTIGPQEKWLQRALQAHVDQAVFLLDTLDCSERSYAFASAKHSNTCAVIERTFAEDSIAQSTTIELSPRKASEKRISKYINYCEAAIIFHIVKYLLNAGYNPECIGIIAPYRAQVELLRKLADQHHAFYQSKTSALNFASVEVNTVDQYQGRDKNIILYSCAKTGSPIARDLERSREAEILEDKRRLTVAITRSKHKLILVGDSACLQQYTPFRALLTHIPGYCKLRLEDDKLGFNWQALLEELSHVISV